MGRDFRFLAFVLAAVAWSARPVWAGEPAAAIARVNGYPVLEVAGRPFFVNGAAFFYERIPRDQWGSDMVALRELGINTLDVYVIWNWHEVSDGEFDFDGRTNPRRDLRGLLRTARELGLRMIVRPGPVIRNEWRNGGYPAWLLERPEYGMPLHDLLEGRYPPTATLQNAHSDDAAAEWLHNTTHLAHARRWLERAMQVVRDSGAGVIAVALDDDQGAYIDNQTWPAPHLAAYLSWLSSSVRRFTTAPVFINTYEMKVTASAPVWAMGDWYQSDAYMIGEHDRAQIEFSTGLLQTQDRGPVMLSEFQAGWLEQPGDVLPRPSDPSNTLLAVHTLLGMGLRGLVQFPAQDTLYPAGWEAPFANSFYAWDAALAPDREPQPRAAPTRRIGGLVSTFGPLLAATHVAADAGIAYTTSAYDPASVQGEALDAIVSRTMQAQKACREASLSCDLVDLRFARAVVLRRYPVLFVPVPSAALSIAHVVPKVAATLADYRRGGGVALTYGGELSRQVIDNALARARHTRNVDSLPGSTLLVSDEPGHGEFLIAANYDASTPLTIAGVTVASTSGGRLRVPDVQVRGRDAIVVPIDVPLRAFSAAFGRADRLRSSTCSFDDVDTSEHRLAFRIHELVQPCNVDLLVAGRPLSIAVDSVSASLVVEPRGAAFLDRRRARPVDEKPRPPRGETFPIRHDVRLPWPLDRKVAADRVTAYQADVYGDGSPVVVLQNDLVRVIVSPEAGARAFVFEDLAKGTNAFTTVGALRDDVTIQPPASTTDRIAKYTHQFPAGTFNRSYKPEIRATGSSAVVRFSYDAPDVVPHGAHFERTITLLPHARNFSVDETVVFSGSGGRAEFQRGVSISSLAVGNQREMSTQITLTPEPHPFKAGATLPIASGTALGFYDSVTRELATIAWRAEDVEHAELEQRADSVVAHVTYAPGRVARTVYGYEDVPSLGQTRNRLASAEAAAQGR